MRGSALNLFQIYARTLGKSVAMPKNKSSAKQPTANSKTTKAVEQTSDPVYTMSNGAVAIRIHAKPGASESRITDIGSDSVGVQIAAPPVDGEANTELIRFLSKLLNLRKSDLSLEKGARSKGKVVMITSQVGASDVLALLKKQIGT